MEMTAMATVPFSLRIDPEIKAQLTQEAEMADRTPSYLANQAIKIFLQAKTAKRKAIEKAVEEADKGIFISEGAVNAWVDSWGTENELPVPEPDIFPDA
jgi:predicted transcriptional regulator